MANEGKKIVVIGAGIGGTGAAALLQNRGNQVTLLERNPFVGGKCTSFDKQGFVCDYAFHIFATGNSGPLGEINRRVGGDLKWHKTHPMGKILFQDKGWFTIPESPKWVVPYGGMAFAKGVIRPNIFNLLYKSLKNHGVLGLLQTMVDIARRDEAFLQTLDDISMRDFLLQFTDDVTMHRLMSIFAFLLVVIPYTEASAGEMLFCLVEMLMKGNMSYPAGGARSISDSYCKAFLRDGGQLRTGCKVKRILVSGGRVRGVETEEGEELMADIVISNAGIKTTVDLAGEDQFPTEYVSYVKDLKYSKSANVIKLGLDTKLPEVPKHFFQYMPWQSPADLKEFIEQGMDPADDSFVIIKSTDWDPAMAPEGKEIIIAGKIGPSEVNSENVKFCDDILDTAERSLFSVFPRIKNHIEWEQRATIKQTAAVTGRATGECIGLSQCVGQTGVNKPKVITPIKDLLLVGSDAGARGVGTEQAAASALHVSYLASGRL